MHSEALLRYAFALTILVAVTGWGTMATAQIDQSAAHNPIAIGTSSPQNAPAARSGGIVLLSEDFEGTFPPAGWNAEDVTGQCPWLSSDDYPMSGWLGGARGAAIDADDCGSSVSADASLITPAMDLSAATNTHLEFDFAYRHLSST